MSRHRRSPAVLCCAGSSAAPRRGPWFCSVSSVRMQMSSFGSYWYQVERKNLFWKSLSDVAAEVRFVQMNLNVNCAGLRRGGSQQHTGGLGALCWSSVCVFCNGHKASCKFLFPFLDWWGRGKGIFFFFYLLISYLWIYFGHRGMLLSKLQILPYLTNQAFDVGKIRGLFQSRCQMKMGVNAYAHESDISKQQ